MVEIINTYRQSVPALRFIGKKYGDKDRVNGTFAHQWSEWFSNGWFGQIEKLVKEEPTFEDADAYIGLMRMKENELFNYWIGLFCPVATQVPDGFSFVDFDAADLGVVWLYGKEGDLYKQEEKCAESCRKVGYKIIPDEQEAFWFFERYTCPRFTTKDENGKIILDICHFIEKV